MNSLTNQSRYSCAIKYENKVLVPIGYPLFFDLHQLVLGRCSMVSDIISKNLLIAIGSAIIFLAFSSMTSSSSQGGNDLFNNVIVVVTVFLPTLLSSSNFQQESLKESLRSRCNQEMKSTAEKLKRHMESTMRFSKIDEVVFAVLHTHHCSTITAFQQRAGLMTPPWLTSPYKCLDKLGLKNLEKFWNKCTMVSNFSFVVDVRLNSSFLTTVLDFFRIEMPPDCEQYFDADFWSKIMNSQDDGFVTLAELKNFDHVLHLIRNSSEPGVWLARLVFEVHKDPDTNILSAEQLKDIRTDIFVSIGAYMIENTNNFLDKLDQGLQELKNQEFIVDTVLSAHQFVDLLLYFVDKVQLEYVHNEEIPLEIQQLDYEEQIDEETSTMTPVTNNLTSSFLLRSTRVYPSDNSETEQESSKTNENSQYNI
jgi:hypothetical protein